MAENENLFILMNGYDSSLPLGASYSNDDLENVAKGLNEKTSESKNIEIPQKVKSLIKLTKKVVNGLNANLVAKYPNLKPFSVENSVTYNALGATGKVELLEAGNAQHLSFNIKKLTKLPSMEVTAIITKAVVDAIAKQNGKENDNEFIGDLLNEDKKNAAEDKKKAKETKDAELAKKVIAGYLRKYLPAIYADDFKKFDNIANYVAGLIVQEMGESEISKILGPFFDLNSLDISSLAIEKVDAFLGRTHEARYLKLTQKAEELAIDPEKEILAVGYEQQAQSILGTDTSDPSYYNLAKKFETLNNGEKVLSGPAVEEFCRFYVHNFLHAHNVKDIEVSFTSKGALGSYIDYGTSQAININLQKLKKMGSYTELAQTLSHELTHAVDSSRNKLAGKVNEDGTGLLNNMEEDISGSGATGDVLKLLNKVNKECYVVNPNERSARTGELSALLFMQKMATSNPALQNELAASISRYITYQQKTKVALESLPQTIANAISERDALVQRGELSEGSRAYRLISERIDYLAERKKALENETEPSVSQEIENQEAARRILQEKQNDLSRQAEEQKREQESRVREEEIRRQAESMEAEREFW